MSFEEAQTKPQIPASFPKSIQKQYSIREQPIKVYCRVRPVQPNEEVAKLQIRKQQNTIVISDGIKNISKSFMFNKVFTQNDPQNKVIDQICLPIVQSFDRQRGSLIFSYGVTNSGKTYTILGSIQEPGILPYLIKKLKEPVFITAIQIYNDEFFSLKTRQKLIPKQYGGFIEFRQYEPQRLDQQNMDSILQQYMINRNQNDTKYNSKSSRSHAIFKIQSQGTIIGVVDLAGSQRTNKNGGNVQETSSINKSLLCLGRCIQSLKEQVMNPTVQVPYRESKLTKVLMEYFGPQFNVYMIVNLNQSQNMLHQNLNVLQYAAVAKDIKHNLSKSAMSHIIKSSYEKTEKSDPLQKQDKSNMRSKRKQNYLINNHQIRSLMASRIKSVRKNNIRECESEGDAEKEYYEGKIKFLNQEIIKILKMKKLQQCIYKLGGIQEEFDINFDYVFEKEKEEDANFMKKLRDQCNSPTQVSSNDVKLVNTSMNTCNYHQDQAKIKQNLKQELKKQLQKFLQEERLRNMQSKETFIGSSFKKRYMKVKNNQLQDQIMKSPTHKQEDFETDFENQEQFGNVLNTQESGFFMKAVQWPLNYMKSSAKKIYDTSSSLIQLAQKSSKKLKNRFIRPKKQFSIVSYALFHTQPHQNLYNQSQVQIQSPNIQTFQVAVQILVQQKDQQIQTQSPDAIDLQIMQKKHKSMENGAALYENQKKPKKKKSLQQKQIVKAAQVSITPIKKRLRNKNKKPNQQTNT